MTTLQTLSEQEEAEARDLYEEFRTLYPGIKNPTDINMPEKAHFLILKGFEKIRLMQKARKQAYDFTKHDDDDATEDDTTSPSQVV